MGKKLTLEIVKQKFLEKGVEYLGKTYENSHQNVLIKSKEGYLANVLIYQVLNCSHKFTTNIWFRDTNKYNVYNFKIYLKDNTKCTLYSEKNLHFGSSKKIPLVCECGNIFYPMVSSIFRNKNIHCKKCRYKETSKRQINNIDDIKINLLNKGYKLLDDYKGCNIPLLLKQLNTNYIGYATYDDIVFKNTKLMPFFFPLNEKFYLYNINQFSKNNGNKPIVYAYKKTSKSCKNAILKCICPICGKKFEISHGTFISSYGNVKCEKCHNKLSSLEEKTINWLNQNNIKYLRQYKFKDCKNILPLPFDFYLPQKKLCIECQGEQHYKPCTKFGKDYKKEYKIRVFRDNIKREYCKNNDIILLEIPWNCFDNNKYIEILSNNILGQK